MQLIQLFRNFFGEKVAFYLFWLTSFNRWLLFVALIGLIVFVLITFSSHLKIPLFENANIDVISLIYLIFCVVIASWCIKYLN